MPLVEVAGGQGVPEGDVPGAVELPEFPGVEEESGLGVDPPGEPGVPGNFPHGEPGGVCPGFVFGSTVEGFVPLAGVGGLVEFAPGTVDGGSELGVLGVVVLPGGVGVLAGGVTVPGVWV